jgi:hypothetical protein
MRGREGGKIWRRAEAVERAKGNSALGMWRAACLVMHHQSSCMNVDLCCSFSKALIECVGWKVREERRSQVHLTRGSRRKGSSEMHEISPMRCG